MDDAQPGEFCAAHEKRIRALEQWSAGNDGRINEKWDQQERHNDECETERRQLRSHIDGKFEGVFRELTSLKVKLAVFTSSAAIAGTVIAKYLLP